MTSTSGTEPVTPPRRRWWLSEWFVTLAVIGVLYATGLLVHVQATLQWVVLQTGLFRPDVLDEVQRVETTPALVVADTAGTIVSTDSLRGEVVFINAWATWCPPCIAEMPSIEAIHRDYGDRVHFILLNLDEDVEQARRFIRRYDLPLHRPAGRIPPWLDVSLIPSTVVIARDGKTAAVSEGMAQYDSRGFRQSLDALLDEAP